MAQALVTTSKAALAAVSATASASESSGSSVVAGALAGGGSVAGNHWVWLYPSLAARVEVLAETMAAVGTGMQEEALAGTLAEGVGSNHGV